MKIKKIIIISLLLLFSFTFFVFAGDPADSDSVRELEVEYPSVGGDTPTDVEYGIAEYVTYVFNLLFIFLGIIFFSVLLYNGVKYMTSTGEIEKAASAMRGIKGAFLGVIIIFSSWLILNTINPGLTDIEITGVGEIIPKNLAPGSYVCNYNLDGISGIISDYEGGEESRASAIERYYEEREKESGDQYCMQLDTWANVVLMGSRSTYFVVPHTNEDGSVEERHGAIFFRRSDGLKSSKKMEGERCEIYIGSSNFYPDFENFGTVGLNAAHSVYPIRINNNMDDHQEVAFYQGYSFNEEVPANYPFFEKQEDADDPEELSAEVILVTSIKETLDHGTFSDFHCERLGFWPEKHTCGIRSVEMTDDVFLIFNDEMNCHIVELDKAYLDETIPTKEYTWLGGEGQQGFSTAIYFDSIDIIRGKIMR